MRMANTWIFFALITISFLGCKDKKVSDTQILEYAMLPNFTMNSLSKSEQDSLKTSLWDKVPLIEYERDFDEGVYTFLLTQEGYIGLSISSGKYHAKYVCRVPEETIENLVTITTSIISEHDSETVFGDCNSCGKGNFVFYKDGELTFSLLYNSHKEKKSLKTLKKYIFEILVESDWIQFDDIF